MKKLFTMFLAVMLLVSLAGVALAETGGCPGCDPCPEFLPKDDTIKVCYTVVPLTGLMIVEDCLELCAYIGCESSFGDLTNPVGNSTGTFNYKAIATGANVRKIVGKLLQEMNTGVSLSLELGTPGGYGSSLGEKKLTTAEKDFVRGLKKMCVQDGIGTLRLSAGMNAEAGGDCVDVQLTIMDQAS